MKVTSYNRTGQYRIESVFNIYGQIYQVQELINYNYSGLIRGGSGSMWIPLDAFGNLQSEVYYSSEYESFAYDNCDSGMSFHDIDEARELYKELTGNDGMQFKEFHKHAYYKNMRDKKKAKKHLKKADKLSAKAEIHLSNNEICQESIKNRIQEQRNRINNNAVIVIGSGCDVVVRK